MKIIIITDQHLNTPNPETGIDYTCTGCWNVCLSVGMKFCPKCGSQLQWDITEKLITNQEN